jgi:DNA-binding NarL/FixJ family response regulator
MPSLTRVLLADDHDLLRQGIRRLLEDTGTVQVIAESATAASALELAARLKPDVVVMDIDLPDMSGIDATAKLIAQSNGHRPRIVGLSCHTDPRVEERMLAAGASAYVNKKSAFSDLAAAIQGKDETSPRAGAALEAPRSFAARQTALTPPATTLTSREVQVLKLMADGQSTKEIARNLTVSVKTIETHRRKLMEKLHLDSVADLTKYALREGVASLNI